MNGWKNSLNPKVHQRAVNKILREMNKNIEEDELWMGRFFIRQWARSVITYEDHSGMYLALEMRLYDKKTKKYVEWFSDSHEATIWGGSSVWERMNRFIVEDLDVWRQGDPRKDKQDWRAVSQDKIIKEATPLWEWQN